VSGTAVAELEKLSPQEVLDRVVGLPITSWSYLSDEGKIRHIGPMAQDFYAAFGLGATDRRIEIADGQGVALAAIQALHELVRGQAEEIAELRSRLDRLTDGRGE
jgi:trimeric autotransporter adhesin